MVSVVVKDPTGNHTISQFPLRGVSVGTIAPHTWMQVNGVTAYVPLAVPVTLTQSQVDALEDAGFVVTGSGG